MLQIGSELTEFLPAFPGLWPAGRTELERHDSMHQSVHSMLARQECVLTEHNPRKTKETLPKGLMRGEQPLIRDQEPQNGESAA